MEQKNENFNSEEYQKKHEGYFQRFVKKMKEWLGKYLKATISIAVLTLIITAIGVYKSCTTSDAGKIIERIYNESKNNVAETKRAIQLVELPDSLENTEEVQRYRAFQNKTLSYALFINSISNEPYLYYSKDEDEEKKNNYYFNILSSSNYSLECFSNYSLNILKEYSAVAKSLIDSKDSIALATFNFFVADEVNVSILAFNKRIKEGRIKINEMRQKKDLKGYLNEMVSVLSSKELSIYFRKLHQYFMNANNVINMHLINIKNNAIEDKYGHFEPSDDNSFDILFTPSYLKSENATINSSDN